MRFGHLNFKDLSRLSKDSMVKWLPLAKVLENVCSECVQCKQTKGSFLKYLPQKTTSSLEVVYSDVCGLMQTKNPAAATLYFLLMI